MEGKSGFDNCIVVDGVPIIEKSRQERLLTKMSKEFAKKGAPFRVEKAYIPWDSSGKSTGYFISMPMSSIES